MEKIDNQHEYSLPSSLLRVGADGSVGQDRAALFTFGNAVVAVVADGAGGMAGGDAAANSVVAAVESALADRGFDPYSGNAWCELLSAIDRRMVLGQTTAVVCVIDEHRIVGASAGDSGAWLVHEGGETHADLTCAQERRPLVGSGEARPVPFETSLPGGTLLLATDGLLRYAPPQAICRIAAGRDVQVASDLLVRLVRLRSGQLSDDVGLVLCRRSPTSVNRIAKGTCTAATNPSQDAQPTPS